MADTDNLNDGMNNLATSVGQLSLAVSIQNKHSADVAIQAAKDSRLIRVVVVATVLILAAITLLFVLRIQTSEATNAIKRATIAIESCTTPAGKCTQRNDAVRVELAVTLAAKTELNGLETELPISQAKNDQIRVDETNVRIAELNAEIAASLVRVGDIQSGRVDPATYRPKGTP